MIKRNFTGVFKPEKTASIFPFDKTFLLKTASTAFLWPK